MNNRGLQVRLTPVLGLCALLAAGGCAAVGPASIANGRAAYTDVITRTNDEQLLNTVVRMRYAETSTMLIVSAVTAQSEISVGSGIQAGAGAAEDSYDGNLVPFSIDGRYSETPTISYTPLSGEEYLKQLVTPISLDLFGLLVDSSRDAEGMLGLLTRRIGTMEAPVHHESGSAADLERTLALMGRLQRAGRLCFEYDLGEGGAITGVDLVLDRGPDAAADELPALLELLGKPAPGKDVAQLRYQLHMGPTASGADSLRLQTRSTLELLQLAARGVEVPRAQIDSGIAPAIDSASARPFLRVKSAEARPEDPFVAVPYRGNWFWLDSTDIPSKHGFVAMQTLLMSCLHSKTSAAPHLTLPVGR